MEEENLRYAKSLVVNSQAALAFERADSIAEVFNEWKRNNPDATPRETQEQVDYIGTLLCELADQIEGVMAYANGDIDPRLLQALVTVRSFAIEHARVGIE